MKQASRDRDLTRETDHHVPFPGDSSSSQLRVGDAQIRDVYLRRLAIACISLVAGLIGIWIAVTLD